GGWVGGGYRAGMGKHVNWRGSYVVDDVVSPLHQAGRIGAALRQCRPRGGRRALSNHNWSRGRREPRREPAWEPPRHWGFGTVVIAAIALPIADSLEDRRGRGIGCQFREKGRTSAFEHSTFQGAATPPGRGCFYTPRFPSPLS